MVFQGYRPGRAARCGSRSSTGCRTGRRLHAGAAADVHPCAGALAVGRGVPEAERTADDPVRRTARRLGDQRLLARQSRRGRAGSCTPISRPGCRRRCSHEPAALVDALFAASRHWRFALHFNKGLAGAPAEAVAAARDTATNPAVTEAFALAISAAEEGPAFPGIAGHEPILDKARDDAQRVSAAMGAAAQARAGARLLRVRERTTSRPTGRARSGARTTRGCAR